MGPKSNWKGPQHQKGTHYWFGISIEWGWYPWRTPMTLAKKQFQWLDVVAPFKNKPKPKIKLGPKIKRCFDINGAPSLSRIVESNWVTSSKGTSWFDLTTSNWWRGPIRYQNPLYDINACNQMKWGHKIERKFDIYKGPNNDLLALNWVGKFNQFNATKLVSGITMPIHCFLMLIGLRTGHITPTTTP